MKIELYSALSPTQKTQVIQQIRLADWDAAQYLSERMEAGKIEDDFGKGAEVLLLFQEKNLAAFCTLAEMDEIDDPTMKPWVGFVYTFPEYRGHRFSGELIAQAKTIAKIQGHTQLFISSEETGLYEKYGFRFLQNAQSIHGYRTQIFVCDL